MPAGKGRGTVSDSKVEGYIRKPNYPLTPFFCYGRIATAELFLIFTDPHAVFHRICPIRSYAYIFVMTQETDSSEEAAVAAAAAALVQQYGDDAEVVATLRAAEFAAAGDVEALAAWDMIIAYLESMRDGAGAPENTGALN